MDRRTTESTTRSTVDTTEIVDTTADEKVVIPVVQEEVVIGKREVEAGRVRVTKTVREREAIVDEPLFREQVQVERVPVNRVIDAPVDVRHEGDTLIVPVVKEVLVVEKRLMLVEELHITKIRQAEHQPQSVTLREEVVDVKRVEGE